MRAPDQAVTADPGEVGRRETDGDGVAVDIQTDEENGAGRDRGRVSQERSGGSGPGLALGLDCSAVAEYVGLDGVCFVHSLLAT